MKTIFKNNFEFYQNKKFIVIGDSVSANETYDNNGKTYCALLCNELNAQFKKNYAIGGTTATYMYKGSNIEKEYKENLIAIDGVRVTRRAFENHELDDVDVAFIEFGHNDQYFNPPIDNGVINVDSVEQCNSFKSSYRYIVSILRKANAKIKIIILNCTYSEYAARSQQWDHILEYGDYRKAIKEIAKELDVLYIDPWNYMEKVFDGKTKKFYYYDDVHLSPRGHKYLFDFILEQ